MPRPCGSFQKPGGNMAIEEMVESRRGQVG